MSIKDTSGNGSNSSRVTRHPLRQDFSFKGKWLVRYDPAEFKYPEILTLLLSVQDRLQLQKLNGKYINLNFSRTVVRNRFFPFADHLFILHSGSEKRLAETDPGAFAIQTSLEPLSSPIRSVNLFFPRLDSDPRWKTMGLPASQLFLASALQSNGFMVSPRLLSLPAAQPLADELSADMAGFSLFEDLLPLLKPFLAGFHALYHGWLAVGGPFPTLAPMAAITHLPQVNLFVRGEAEQELPLILDALNRGDADALLKQKGLFWQQPGLIVMADFDRMNRPETFSRFQVNFDFFRPEHLRHGLEMNFSRGCGRGCLFCCRVQGNKFRKLPLAKAEDILIKYKDKIAEFAIQDTQARTININDDDILQDPIYAASIFALVKKHGFRIHGIQTSPSSLFGKDEQVNFGILTLLADSDLYNGGRPLVWLGSDVFLSRRARRLGKVLPSSAAFANLLAELEKHGLRHFHYWISSDGDSTWEEFSEELALIIGFYGNFPGFGLLAHAPFIVPYPASRMFGRLEAGDPRLKVKLALEAADPRFSYKIVDRIETKWPQLNSLLRNEKAGGEKGFFDYLKEKDFAAVTQLAYHFLKQEQLQAGDTNHNELIRAGERLAGLIESII